MSIDLKQFAKGEIELGSEKKNAVVYTRVSTKEQADKNASLHTQKKYCDKYAEENGLNILEYFGGTYESAKNDERKQFQKMLTYVKRNKSIGYILVYSYDRFSRSGPSGAFISYELKKAGIKLVSATQSVDHSDPSGDFMEGIYHLFSQFDNELRKGKSVTGMKEKLKEGYWPFAPPTGYENLNKGATADKHKLVINEKGKLLKKAFLWKAEDNLSLAEISNKLKNRGWEVETKRLSHFFQNPFYCGLITSKMLEGGIVVGKHEPLISNSQFLKVHENLSVRPSGYQIVKSQDELPLKQFVKCESCGESYTGYLVKKKNLYYYKCNTKGCKKNRSQKILHAKFEELIESFQINQDLKGLFVQMMEYTISKHVKNQPDNSQALKMELSSQKSKLNSIEERFVIGEINKDLYLKYRLKYQVKIDSISKEISNTKFSLSNLDKVIDKSIKIASDLPSLWRKGDYLEKRKLQYLLFPEGIRYSREKDNYRTFFINPIFELIHCISEVYEDKKSGNNIDFDEISTLVVPHGLEPWTP